MDGGSSLRGGLGGFTPLAAELGDLKRIRDASSPDSLTVRAFRRAWGRLADGEDARSVALSTSADALAAARLGGIDRAVLEQAGVADPRAVLARSFDEVAGPIDNGLRSSLRASLGHAGSAPAAPAFAEALIRQPRAGATCPGKPRLVLEPPENHGDHCLVVAVLGAVLAGHYDADPATVFVAGLAHHLHNAVLPDSGFAGEVLLGDELAPLMRRLFDRALATLPPAVSATVAAEGGKDFERNLELASRAGSPASNVGEVARYLLHREDKSWGFEWWSPAEHTDEWFERLAADPFTKTVLEMFIEKSLPDSQLSYPDDFAVKLGRLATDLTPAFMAAACRAVRRGVLSSDGAIAEGALEDLDGFETIVDMAVEELTPTGRQRAEAAALRLDLTNDVYDNDHAQHLSENEDGYTAHELLKSYVQRMRRDKGWERLAQHRHADMLRSYWTQQLADSAKEKRPGKRELAGAFSAAYGTKDEDDLWLALTAAWDETFLPQLSARLTSGGSTERVEQAAIACAIERVPETLRNIVGQLAAKGDTNRLVELAATLAWIRRGGMLDGSKHVEAADAAATHLRQPYRSIGNAVLTTSLKMAPRLSDAGRTALSSIATPSNAVRSVRLRLDKHVALATAEDVRWALDEAKDAETAILGVEAAIRRGMAAEVDKALEHRFAHVVAAALTAVASPLAAPLPKNLLALADHRASPVRRALADALAAKPHRNHQRALLTLLTDQWSRHSQYYGQDDNNYPIARTAAEAQADQPAPTTTIAARLLAIATDTADPQVRRSVLTVLAKTGDQALQRAIFDLAVQPGRHSVGRGAAAALLASAPQLDPAIIAGITAPLLATRFEPVSAILALLLGWRGDPAAARDAAGQLATNHKRRVLLLLVVWLLKDRDRAVAEEIAAMLPVGHTGVAWALGATPKPADDSTVADLGEPTICEQVLSYMQIGVKSQKNKRGPGRRKRDAES